MLFDLAVLDAAERLVRRHVAPTPQYAWPLLGAATGAEVWVKHENHTPTGAFKVRGGLVRVARAVDDGEIDRGLISATTGNHGQSLAYAGRAAGVPVTIVVPTGNSPAKNAAMRGFGARLIEHGVDFQAAREHSVELAAAEGLTAVGPFHPDLVAGVATGSRELLTAAPFDAYFVPVGMGSGICAALTVRDLLGLDTTIVGVVAEGAPATQLSVAAGHVVSTETVSTFVDGVACRVPDATAIETMCAGGAEIVSVSDDECAAAIRLLFETTRNLAEPGGAMALAGLLRQRHRWAGKRVAVVLSGGNLDTDRLTTILDGATPQP